MSDKDKKPQDTEDLHQIMQESSEKASSKIAEAQQIEKQNAEGKRLLRLLPFQIFLLVADADGKIDPKEVAQFKEFLSRREKHCSNIYTRRMYHATVINYTALTNRYQGGHIKKDFQIVEKAMAYVGMCVKTKLMKAICKDLSELAVAIAEASGGFMGVTSPICKEEAEVISQLQALFEALIEQSEMKEEPDVPLSLEF